MFIFGPTGNNSNSSEKFISGFDHFIEATSDPMQKMGRQVQGSLF